LFLFLCRLKWEAEMRNPGCVAMLYADNENEVT